ncbi:hypothetical protein Tco_1028253 [Tanacetum coccineum]|uniref:Uncharacterized protein n=1 Tax=Tanacetum coccineum TaxID=301880 RepID=A0ABQ5G1W1_9ASTR
MMHMMSRLRLFGFLVVHFEEFLNGFLCVQGFEATRNEVFLYASKIFVVVLWLFLDVLGCSWLFLDMVREGKERGYYLLVYDELMNHDRMSILEEKRNILASLNLSNGSSNWGTGVLRTSVRT